MKEKNLQQILPVTLINLSKKDINGREGKIIGFDYDNDRYRIIIDNSTIALKPENVLLPRDCCAVIQNIKSNVSLNGKRCKVIDADIANQRYTVSIGTQVMKLKFDCVVVKSA